ncbi:MAG: 2-phospho-L-lactate guanylyltransferase [Candidatus Nanopelagicales bacterium]
MIRQTEWCVVIPLSPAGRAKSRLGSLGALRQRLALAFATDVAAAAASASSVGRVLLVGDGTIAVTDAELIDVGGADLNTAIAAGESEARKRGHDRVAVLVADLPAARSDAIDELLRQARTQPRAFVADHTNGGTTVLTTTGPALSPTFGPNSAARHRASGAVAIEVSMRLRIDVDVPEDLPLAQVYGLGPATSAALGSDAEAAEAAVTRD